jgi:hypothetical protein
VLFGDQPEETLDHLVGISRQQARRRGKITVRQRDPGDTFIVMTVVLPTIVQERVT